MGITHNESCVSLEWDNPVETLSSALYNGGRGRHKSLLNLLVDHNTADEYGGFEPPEITLEKKAEALRLGKPMAGMMTSASMKSFRWRLRKEGALYAFCGMTVGTTNARAAGDPADCLELEAHQAGSGTINMVVGTNAALSESALAEALMLSAESRAWTLLDFDVKSPVSGRKASGTGTDSILVFSGNGPEIHFCGKHTLMGEMLADVVIRSLSDAMRIIKKLEAGLLRTEDLPLQGYEIP
jgi:adenosylcobinamide amidohydrolase